VIVCQKVRSAVEDLDIVAIEPEDHAGHDYDAVVLQNIQAGADLRRRAGLVLGK